MGLLSGIILAPLLAAAVLLVVPNRSRGAVRLVALLGATTSLLGSIRVAFRYDLAVGGVQMREELALLPDLGIAWKLGVDGWGVSLLLLTAIIIFAGIWASWTMREREKEFFILLLVLVAGVFGVFVSLDLFIFFLFYEIAVLPMYLLIGVWGSSKPVKKAGPLAKVLASFDLGSRQYAAMKLTLMLMGGSALILASFLAMVLHTGVGTWDLEVIQVTAYPPALQKLLFPFLWIGFGTLAGVFPWHTWSPDGHASAPTAVSMLHAGVLMKLGAFGVIRVAMICLPEGAAFWAFAVGTVAVINIVWGALSAMGQTDLKYVIAYSSVSHMGIVMLGAATLQVDGWNGAIFQMFAHGVMTGLFFALVGLVYERAHTREIFEMGGFAARMPAVAVFFTIGGLSSLGLPGTAGFAAELLVFLGAWKTVWWWAIPAIAGAIFTAVYVLRATRAIFWGPPADLPYPDVRDAQRTEWVAPILLTACILLFGIAPDLLLQYIDPMTLEFLGPLTDRISVSTAGVTP
jgi:NADH-quinone oxidoreductase subunit M